MTSTIPRVGQERFIGAVRRSPTARRLLTAVLIIAGFWGAWFCWGLAPGQLDDTGMAGREREPLRWAMWTTYATALAWAAAVVATLAGRRAIAVVAESLLGLATVVLLFLSF